MKFRRAAQDRASLREHPTRADKEVGCGPTLNVHLSPASCEAARTTSASPKGGGDPEGVDPHEIKNCSWGTLGGILGARLWAENHP
jgi:hypothetical protein